jgi:thioredoxin 1
MLKTLFIPVAIALLLGGGLGALMGYLGKCKSGTCPLTATPQRGAMFGAVFSALLVLSTSSTAPRRTDGVASEHVVQITSAEEFSQRVLQSKQPVLVDFYSDTCGPCRRLSPTINDLADEFAGRAVIAKVDVNALPDLAGQFQIGGIPAVLFYVNGQEATRVVGYNPKEVYARHLEQLI